MAPKRAPEPFHPPTGTAAPKRGRPRRDSGHVMAPGERAALDALASSNSTMNAFMGGRQKSWMMGGTSPVAPRPRPAQVLPSTQERSPSLTQLEGPMARYLTLSTKGPQDAPGRRPPQPVMRLSTTEIPPPSPATTVASQTLSTTSAPPSHVEALAPHTRRQSAFTSPTTASPITRPYLNSTPLPTSTHPSSLTAPTTLPSNQPQSTFIASTTAPFTNFTTPTLPASNFTTRTTAASSPVLSTTLTTGTPFTAVTPTVPSIAVMTTVPSTALVTTAPSTTSMTATPTQTPTPSSVVPPPPASTSMPADRIISEVGQTTWNINLAAHIPVLQRYRDLLPALSYSQRHLLISRVDIVLQACHYNDLFYMAMHQVFCDFTLRPGQVAELASFGPNERAGMQVLSDLLSPNESLPADFLRHQATFPASWEALRQFSVGHRTALAAVRDALGLLGMLWKTYEQICLRRGHPPLTSELVSTFNVKSVVLQRVIFRAISRRLGGVAASYDGLERLEQVFRADQAQFYAILARMHTAWPTTIPLAAQANNRTVAAYRAVQAQFSQGISEAQQRALIQKQSQLLAQAQAQPQPQTASPVVPNVTTPTMAPGGGYTFVPSSGPVAQAGRTSSHPQPRQSHVVPIRTQQVATTATTTAGQPSPRHLMSIVPSQPSMVSPHSPYAVSTFPSASAYRAPTTTATKAGVPPPPRPLLTQQFPLAASPQSRPPGVNGHSRAVNPVATALHQAHLRAPHLMHVHPAPSSEDPMQRLYRYVDRWAVPPKFFPDQFCILKESFRVEEESASNTVLPRRLQERTIDGLPIVAITDHTTNYRVRCCRAKKPGRENLYVERLDEWLAQENIWPEHIFLRINRDHIDVRRRAHHGRDISMDISLHVQAGENTLDAVLSRSFEDVQTGVPYAVAVEVIPFRRGSQIVKDVMAREPFSAESMHAWLSQQTQHTPSSPHKDGDDDEEVAVVSHSITLSVTDPYTATMWEIPVRGRGCQHRDCFDLTTFLTARPMKTRIKADQSVMPRDCRMQSSEDGQLYVEIEASDPDAWKCPLCGGDARPSTLAVDEFFRQVRKVLAQRGQLDVKAIVVKSDGSWEAKVEQQTRTRTGDVPSVVQDDITITEEEAGRQREVIRRQHELLVIGGGVDGAGR